MPADIADITHRFRLTAAHAVGVIIAPSMPSNSLPQLDRVWVSVGLPGYREAPRFSTYGRFSVDELPPIERSLDESLNWLLAEPRAGEWAITDDRGMESFQGGGVREFAGSRVALPQSFITFMASPEPGSRIRSATGCYIDFGDRLTPAADGGTVIHFLSDQQWVLHWLLHVGGDGSEAVLCARSPYGFAFEGDKRPPDYDEEFLAVFRPTETDAVVCAESFPEFLYRYWIENEIVFRADDKSWTQEQQRYLDHYLKG